MPRSDSDQCERDRVVNFPVAPGVKWPWARSRSSDPQTSFDAGDSMEGSIPAQHKQILEILSDGLPRAAEQISDMLGHDIWRRLSELERLGKIEKCKDQPRHKNRSGRQANKYRICDV